MKRKHALRLWAAALPLLLLCASCVSSEKKPEKEKEEKSNRFAFLHREKSEPHRESYEALEDELVTDHKLKDARRTESRFKTLETSGAPVRSEGDAGKKSSARSTGATGKSSSVGTGANAVRFYDDFVALNGDEELSVSLTFNSAPLLDVLSAFADILGFNFVADNDLKGVVTLNLNSKMTRRELWNTFDRMLTLAGAGVKVEDSLIRVMSTGKFPLQPDQKLGKSAGNTILFFPLTTATGKEVVTQLKPFLSREGVCVELTKPNAVLVCELPENMPKIKQLLEFIDRNSRRNWPRAVMRCRNILPSKVVLELQEILPVLGFNVYKTTDRTELPGAVQLAGIDRLDVVVASAATGEAVEAIRAWVDLLDSANSSNQERVFVYKVRHNKAAQLAQALAVIYQTSGSSLSIDSSTGDSKLENINSSSTGRTTAATSAQNRNRTVSAANTVGNTQTDVNSNIFDNQVRVFADGVLNRLVIRTTLRTYASIKALLDRLDVVPAQVLLQVLVVEVTLSEETQFGLEFSGYNSGSNVMSLMGTNYQGTDTKLNPFTSLYDSDGNKTGAQINTGNERQSGATFLLADPSNPQKRFGYIRALAGNGLVKVLSSPQLLVTSHNQASIQVGSSIPVITSGITNSSSSGEVTQSYTYKDVGVILEVTPQITSTDLISLQISQELSDAKTNTTSDTIDSPEITKRVVQTAMTIANGQTMIIGGLIQEKKNDSLESIPGINQIPVLNRLLGSTNASIERSEILVMITGYIVNERSKVEDMISRYNDALKVLNDFDAETANGGKKRKSKKPSMLMDKDFWM